MELLFWGIWFWNNSNAKSVYVTDFNPTTVENLKHNILLNGDRFEEKDSSSQADFSTERVHASAIDWDDESTWPNEKLDIVIGSDLIYQSTIVPLLHKAVQGLLKVSKVELPDNWESTLPLNMGDEVDIKLKVLIET